MVADDILENYDLFCMRDTDEIYLYRNGVYRNDNAEKKLRTVIRDTHDKYYIEYWENINKDYPLEHIFKAGSKFVFEVICYIKDYTHISRKEIDEVQLNYINFKNGLFDIAAWKIINHTPDMKIIAQFNVTYNENAECPMILNYMKTCELTQNNIDVLTEYAGYCLTPEIRMQKALMLYGNGANGKSVYINLLKIIFGTDYFSGETKQNLEEDKYRVANLYGKRLNAFPDLKDTPLQTNEVFNTLTGNDLMLSGERKYQSSFDFIPTTKLLFSANKVPFAYSDITHTIEDGFLSTSHIPLKMRK